MKTNSMSLGFGVLVRWELPALLPSPKRWTSVCTPTPMSGNSPDQFHEQSLNERHQDLKARACITARG